MNPRANLVLRALSLLLIVLGVILIFTSGWAAGLPAIVIGLALVVDQATRRRQGDAARS